jgi:hypothetical protein
LKKTKSREQAGSRTIGRSTRQGYTPPTPQMARLALLAAALAVAGLVAICASFSRPGGAQTDELMGEFDLYRPAISSLDFNSPSPLDYHTFDYTRPDFAARCAGPP